MIRIECYDVEVLPNFFSICFIDLASYLDTFKDIVDGKGKPIPIIQKISVKELLQRLDTVKYKQFYITDKDDSQLFSMIEYINGFKANELYPRSDLYGYNSQSYDNLMIAALLMYFGQTDTTKELITKLYETSKKIIELQDNKDGAKNDFLLRSLRKYPLPFKGVDVMKIFALNKAGTIVDSKTGEKKYVPKGLKQTSINLQWYELLEYELPDICDKDYHYYAKDTRYKGYDYKKLTNVIDKWDRYIIDEYIPDMMHYNKNDVFIVCEIVRLNPDEIKSRYAVSASYKVDVLNSSRSNMANVLFQKFYTKYSGIPYEKWKDGRTKRTAMNLGKIIFNCVEFKTQQLQDLLKEIKKTTLYRVSKDAFEKEVIIGDVNYTLATGGLHSKDRPMEIWSTTDWDISGNSSTGKLQRDNAFTIIHWDIASYYPSIMAAYSVAPAHMVTSAFRNLIQWMKDTRVTVKHSEEAIIDGIPKDVLALVLKIVINSIYGKFGDENSPLYDRLATLQVTINGQLMILMLCEELELNGIHVLSANTDGIMVKLYEKDKELFNDIADRWQEKTKMKADADILHCLIARDINNYTALFREEKKGVRKLKTEFKGAMNPDMYRIDLQKGYDKPIVAKAVYEYFINKVPIMETLQKATNILDFCMTQNVGRQFHVEETKIVNGMLTRIVCQRYVRFYISNDGYTIEKVHNITNSRSRMAAGVKVCVVNTLDDTNISLRNIDFKYYYNECMKLIDPIKLGITPKGKGKSKIKRYSGLYNNLFDDVDE